MSRGAGTFEGVAEPSSDYNDEAMATRYIALLRGINVGRAKRVAMADLRALVGDLGSRDVRTLLNSGNVVFTAAPEDPGELASRIEAALEKEVGVSSRTTVLTAAELAQIAEENSLVEVATDPSRLLIAIFREPADVKKLEPLLAQDWHPDSLALGGRAAYLWCPDGMMKSRIPEAVERLAGDGVTTRNWRTISKLNVLAQAQE